MCMQISHVCLRKEVINIRTFHSLLISVPSAVDHHPWGHSTQLPSPDQPQSAGDVHCPKPLPRALSSYLP